MTVPAYLPLSSFILLPRVQFKQLSFPARVTATLCFRTQSRAKATGNSLVLVLASLTTSCLGCASFHEGVRVYLSLISLSWRSLPTPTGLGAGRGGRGIGGGGRGQQEEEKQGRGSEGQGAGSEKVISYISRCEQMNR